MSRLVYSTSMLMRLAQGIVTDNRLQRPRNAGVSRLVPSLSSILIPSLSLESLLFFANEYGDRAVTVVDESVHAGDYWYPLAVASIHMTSAALEMGTSVRTLSLFHRSVGHC